MLVGGGVDEALLGLGEVDGGAAGVELGGEVEPLLDELHPLERICGGEVGVDRSQSLLDRFGRSLAAPLRLVGLERFEVPADRPPLLEAFGEGGIVLVGHWRVSSICRPETGCY